MVAPEENAFLRREMYFLVGILDVRPLFVGMNPPGIGIDQNLMGGAVLCLGRHFNIEVSVAEAFRLQAVLLYSKILLTSAAEAI